MNLLVCREHQTLDVDFEINTAQQQTNTNKLFEVINNQVVCSYFIGVQWLTEDTAIYVEPKINKEEAQTNYLEMLFSALKHPEIAQQHTKELFNIDFDANYIEIEQKQDLLTPLLVVQFLSVVKQIVKKGLKKSYYKVQNNLTAKVKGKILVNETIKKNIVKQQPLKSFCSYDEFGLNNIENRLLKKTLAFIQRYLPTIKHLSNQNNTNQAFIETIFNYVRPAFEFISEDANLNEIKHTKTNAFYKEYEEALRLAKLILKRFGYHINNIQEEKLIKVPPFWIDMAKLFELYVLGLLKDTFGENVFYHFKSGGNELDYLLKTDKYKLVIDAKYKPIYTKTFMKEDIRQISAYARLRKVYEKLDIAQNQVIDCLIIYPNQENGYLSFDNLDLLNDNHKVKKYIQFYKIGIKLPKIN